jgi:AmmeMemoRadiSam system protein B
MEGWLGDVPDSCQARAVIAPHAGFSYSGPTAAFAYKNMDLTGIDRIFVLGPSHHFYLKGCALTGCSQYQTPCGNLQIDLAMNEELLATGIFEENMTLDVDQDEHSIEMQLPYIAHAIAATGRPTIKVVPILVGALDARAEALYGRSDIDSMPSILLSLVVCISTLAKYLDNPSIFFAISSDFCHWGTRFDYTPYKKDFGPIHKYIEALDFEGIKVNTLAHYNSPRAPHILASQCIQKKDPALFHSYLKRTKNTICGRHPIAVLLNAIESAQTDFEVS